MTIDKIERFKELERGDMHRELELENQRLQTENSALRAENERLRAELEDAPRTECPSG